jgi:hypothetical protein
VSAADREGMEEVAAEPCRSCAEGRMSAWAAVRAGTAPVAVGELVLVGRVCDRCRAAELQARRPAPSSRRPATPKRRRSSGGELLDGVLRNLRAAVGEVWKALSTRRAGGSPRR